MRPDAIVMRHAASGAPHFLSRHLQIPIVNAGDGTHEHPTQALLDARTILDRGKSLEGLRVAIIGDIAHSRVARSNVHLLSRFGADIILCGPPSLLPRELAQLAPGVRLAFDMTEAIRDADVIMMLRVQLERRTKRPWRRANTSAFTACASNTCPGETRRHRYASRPHQSRTRTQFRSGGQPALRDSESGGKRSRRTNGGAGKNPYMSSLLITGGRVIDPASGGDGLADVLIRDGRIEAVGTGLSDGWAANDGQVIHADGAIVAPGFIDMHVHLREPGFEHAETIESGARAAAAGGFTTICCMPNTSPVNDSAMVTSYIFSAPARSPK